MTCVRGLELGDVTIGIAFREETDGAESVVLEETLTIADDQAVPEPVHLPLNVLERGDVTIAVDRFAKHSTEVGDEYPETVDVFGVEVGRREGPPRRGLGRPELDRFHGISCSIGIPTLPGEISSGRHGVPRPAVFGPIRAAATVPAPQAVQEAILRLENRAMYVRMCTIGRIRW
jgi:hypothetical protein